KDGAARMEEGGGQRPPSTWQEGEGTPQAQTQWRPLGEAPAVVQDTARRLAQRCQDGLGGELYAAARRCLRDSASSLEPPGSQRHRLLELLGEEKIGFLSLIDQLVHMEMWGLQEGPVRNLSKVPSLSMFLA
ncbi:unnamed protein product, partial [Prorocentrum cordatum]